jgi:N-acetyl-anhydromuramyl-L-alanine amidase AmpD
MRWTVERAPWLVAVLAAGLTGLLAHGESYRDKPGTPLERSGDELIVAGRLFHTGTKVVTWLDPGGYDAYRPRSAFSDRVLPSSPAAGCNVPSRLGSARRWLPGAAAKLSPAPPGSTAVSLDALREQVDQFVVHFDQSYTSAHCFKVLHDVRGLSVQLMLDLDGTIYQTCDLRERARHAGGANDRSIGVEIAHPGFLSEAVQAAYGDDGRLRLPAGIQRGALGPGPFKPARRQPVAGTIQGREVRMYDFTAAQYKALVKLTAALHRIFPKIALDVPRGDDGAIIPRVLSREELRDFSGLLGHYHVSQAKLDPGPAFDWEKVLARAKRLTRRYQ